MDLREAKRELRERVLAQRAGQAPELLASWSGRITEHLLALPQWAGAHSVLLYCAMPGEVQTAALIAAAWQAGKRVTLPRMRREPVPGAVPGPNGKPPMRRWLDLHQYAGSPDSLVAGAWGILEPPATAPLMQPEEVDLAVVPGVAFDLAGGRLGYGGGFFDGLLPKLREGAAMLGVAFDLQLVPAVPCAEHDVRVGGVVTESGVHWAAST